MESHVEGHWREIESRSRLLWDKLTNDDWTAVGGDFEKLVSLVRERHGYARHAVARQLNLIMGSIRANAHLPYHADTRTQPERTS